MRPGGTVAQVDRADRAMNSIHGRKATAVRQGLSPGGLGGAKNLGSTAWYLCMVMVIKAAVERARPCRIDQPLSNIPTIFRIYTLHCNTFRIYPSLQNLPSTSRIYPTPYNLPSICGIYRAPSGFTHPVGIQAPLRDLPTKCFLNTIRVCYSAGKGLFTTAMVF